MKKGRVKKAAAITQHLQLYKIYTLYYLLWSDWTSGYNRQRLVRVCVSIYFRTLLLLNFSVSQIKRTLKVALD